MYYTVKRKNAKGALNNIVTHHHHHLSELRRKAFLELRKRSWLSSDMKLTERDGFIIYFSLARTDIVPLVAEGQVALVTKKIEGIVR